MSVTLKDVGSGFKRTAINQNFTDIESEINNNLLNKDGSTALESDLDFNSNRAINLADGVFGTDAVNVNQLNAIVSGAGGLSSIAQARETQLGSQAVANVFTLTGITYAVGTNTLSVYRNGQRLEKTIDYTETTANSVTLTFTPNSTDRFVFITNDLSTSEVTTTAAITHTQSGTDYSLDTYLQNRHVVNVKDFGAVGDGVTYDTAAIQATFDAVNGANASVYFPAGDYLLGSIVNINSPGGGSDAYRNMEVVCDHEAKFYGADNTVSLFNIEGQRRFKWSGGWFKRANVCFQGAEGASPQPSDAYCYFNNVIFDGESTGAIQKCYSSTTPIGVYWTDCDFGTDAANDQIDLAVDMPGNDIGQSNLAKFTRCTFINNVNCVNMPTSTYARLGTSFTDCRFESNNGYVINAGTNTRDLRLTNCYFEGVGSASVKPIIFAGGKLVIDGGQIVGAQNNTEAFIAASAGVEIETRGKIEYLATTGTTVFADFASGISQPQYLYGVHIQGTGTETYKSLLFSTASQADEQYIEWELPRIGSTLIDTQVSKKLVGNFEHKGYISRETEIVNLAAQATNYDLANINIPNAGNGLRISVESYQTIQGVGHAGQFNEWLAHWNGATWTFTSVGSATTVAGFTFTLVNVDINNFKVQVQRSSGGATNTPFRALVTVRQAANNMEGNEIQIS